MIVRSLLLLLRTVERTREEGIRVAAGSVRCLGFSPSPDLPVTAHLTGIHVQTVVAVKVD